MNSAFLDHRPPQGFDGVLVEGLPRPLRLDALPGVEAKEGRGHSPKGGHAH